MYWPTPSPQATRIMTLEQIRNRIQELQEQINQLASELPEDTRISFGTRYLTGPATRTGRKELVITVGRPEHLQV